MSIGWFDAFRENGAPTWYGETKTPVRLDLGLAILLWVFLTPTLAFLLVLPGIRRLRALSAFAFLFSMAIGACLAVAIHYPGWHCGQLQVFTAFRAHSRQRIAATLGVNIGLTHVNITLSSDPSEEPFVRPPLNNREISVPIIVDSDISTLLFGPDSSQSANVSSAHIQSNPIDEDDMPSEAPELFYNERFDFDDVSGMEVREVLRKGLPFPILRVVEYLSVDRNGFLWGKQYRLAGYYAMATLWLAFALWLLQMLLLCLLPQRFGQVAMLCGICTLFADAVYAWHAPGVSDLFLVFPGPDDNAQRLQFHLSTCFFATLAAGVASTTVGGILWLLEARSSFRMETFFSAYLDRMCRPEPPGARARPLWSTHSSRRLPTPKGSFSSLGRTEQTAIGWKRRRRTLRRVPKAWHAVEHHILELRGPPAGRRICPPEVPPGTETPSSKHSQRSSQQDEEEREDCSHGSQPSSSSSTSTRQLQDDSGLESEEARSPRTPPGEGISSLGRSFWLGNSEWAFWQRERDKGSGDEDDGKARSAEEKV